MVALALAAWLSTPQSARAGKYDLDLTTLGFSQSGAVSPNDEHFRSLSSEFGALMAMQPMDPADSLGLSGFSFSADVSVNTLGGHRRYWRDPTHDQASEVASTLQLLARKGLYPGLELGAGAVHLFESSNWAVGGYVKLALHEGFHHLPIPSISIRGSFFHVLGARDLNLTTASPAVTISHVFGVGKTFTLTPYLGYEALIILSRSSILDGTPNCDEFTGTGAGCGDSGEDPTEFVFQNAGAIVRHRPHVGLRLLFSVMRLGIEAMFVPPGSSEGTLDGETVRDDSIFQQQYTLSVGLDF